MSISKWDQSQRYEAQSQIVKQALATPDHSLNELLKLMRDTGEASLYLAGTRLDNAHCFGSGDVGALISVLPEDAAKAGEPGYHPGSTEVYVTFQGALMMECLEDGRVKEKEVGQNNALVIAPGTCHRVRYDVERKAASIIVKTNLNFQPGVIRCDDCGYYPEKSRCPLHQSWSEELERLGSSRDV